MIFFVSPLLRQISLQDEYYNSACNIYLYTHQFLTGMISLAPIQVIVLCSLLLVWMAIDQHRIHDELKFCKIIRIELLDIRSASNLSITMHQCAMLK